MHFTHVSQWVTEWQPPILKVQPSGTTFLSSYTPHPWPQRWDGWMDGGGGDCAIHPELKQLKSLYQATQYRNVNALLKQIILCT